MVMSISTSGDALKMTRCTTLTEIGSSYYITVSHPNMIVTHNKMTRRPLPETCSSYCCITVVLLDMMNLE